MAKIETKHIHKFKRLKYKTGNITFFCALPDCNVKINPALALGKRSLCWRCNEPFIMTDYSLRLAKPHCENCHKPKNIDDKNDLEVVAQNNNEILHELSLSERLQKTINKILPEEIEDEL